MLKIPHIIAYEDIYRKQWIRQNAIESAIERSR
jgi:hypothetical protein